MLWSPARARHRQDLEIQTQLAAARREHPESGPWLALLEAALAESENGGSWEAAVPHPAAGRAVKAPLLARAEIAVDGRAARRWVRRLSKLAPQAHGRRVDGVVLLEAALCQDDTRVDALAAGAGRDAKALRVVGQMATLPLLQACARGLTAEVAPTWWEGYCPVCGAWPVLAEYVGLERKRQLRCGRCGTGWAMPLLRCVFCGESRHEELGYLAPEGAEQMRKVETCRTCQGYLKALTTVRALAPWAILLDDLTTVHLDIAALERGYERPGRPGYALGARVVERPRAALAFSFGWRGAGS